MSVFSILSDPGNEDVKTPLIVSEVFVQDALTRVNNKVATKGKRFLLQTECLSNSSFHMISDDRVAYAF